MTAVIDQTTGTDQTPRPTTLAEIRERAVIPVFSTAEPNYAGLYGVSRWTAYEEARSGRLPTTKAGRRVLVLVQPLRRDLGDLPALAERAASDGS